MRLSLASSSGGLRSQLGVVAVPVEGADEAVAELDFGAPAGQLAQLGRVDVLAVDLADGVAGAKEFGLEVGAGDVDDRLQDLGHREGALAAGVECLPRSRPAGADCVLDRQVGGDGVADVEEVSFGAAVGANLWPA